MKFLRRAFTLALAAVLAPIAGAWNDTGHMVIAAIAYDHLTPRAKAEADRLLQIGGTPRTSDFITAACWADDIRRDRHETSTWHYIDLHFRTDGKPTANKPDAENAVWAIEKFKAVLADKTQSDANRAEALRFILHFVGDIHQPLHAVSHDTDQLPEGDAGGNKFHILPPNLPGDYQPKNLHALWDEGCGLFPGLGRDSRPLTQSGREQIESIAKKIEHDDPASHKLAGDKNPMDWAKEGLKVSQDFVYSLPEGTQPTSEYLKKGQEISEMRASEAGARLAVLLNSVLK